MNARQRGLLVASAACALQGLASAEDAPSNNAAAEEPSVTPYRPSVSTPAALSAPGWLEIELGGQHSTGASPPSRSGVPYTLKLAFSPDWGVRVGGEAWVRQDDGNGSRIDGFGDTGIIVKRRFAVDDASAFGLEGGITAPTGRKGISAGKPSETLNAIYSADIGSYHTDLNINMTRLGAIDTGTGRVQTGWAAALSKSLTEQWGVVGEFSGTQQSKVPGTSQFLLAASYNVSKAATFDAGFARSTRDATWSYVAGVTFLAAKLF